MKCKKKEDKQIEQIDYDISENVQFSDNFEDV